jgi:hypothetical protein
MTFPARERFSPVGGGVGAKRILGFSRRGAWAGSFCAVKGAKRRCFSTRFLLRTALPVMIAALAITCIAMAVPVLLQ